MKLLVLKSDASGFVLYKILTLFYFHGGKLARTPRHHIKIYSTKTGKNASFQLPVKEKRRIVMVNLQVDDNFKRYIYVCIYPFLLNITRKKIEILSCGNVIVI
jgi:hypothetical protein